MVFFIWICRSLYPMIISTLRWLRVISWPLSKLITAYWIIFVLTLLMCILQLLHTFPLLLSVPISKLYKFSAIITVRIRLVVLDNITQLQLPDFIIWIAITTSNLPPVVSITKLIWIRILYLFKIDHLLNELTLITCLSLFIWGAVVIILFIV